MPQLSFTSVFSGARYSSPVPKTTSGECNIFVDSEAARERIVEIINEFPIFLEGDVNKSCLIDLSFATHCAVYTTNTYASVFVRS
jgi:hypothetical protein